MHGQSGQATVEWVALVLLAALVLGAGAALAGREPDRGLGELVAKRIAKGAGELGPAAAAAAPAAAPTGRASAPSPRASAPSPRASAPSPRASAPPARRGAPPPAAVDDLGAIRGIGSVARHAWILCLGYQRWRYEREHPIAAILGLPVGEALGIVNDCINPHSYLFED